MNIKNYLSESELAEISGGSISPATKARVKEWVVHMKRDRPQDDPHDLIRLFSIAKDSSPEDHKEFEEFVMETWRNA